MTHEKFIAMKSDLLGAYGRLFCEEALQEVQSADTAEGLVGVLHRYAFDMWKHKYIPTEWVRRWFAGEQEILNACGCYIDQQVSPNDPQADIVCFGSCRINLILKKPQRLRVLLQDDSHMNLCTYGVCMVSVYMRDKASLYTAYQSQLSTVKKHQL